MIATTEAMAAPDDLVVLRSAHTPERHQLARVVAVHEGHPRTVLLPQATDPQPLDTLDPQGEVYVITDRQVYAEAALSLAVDHQWPTLDRLLSDIAALRRTTIEPRCTPFGDCPYRSHNLDTDLSGYVVFSASPEDGYQHPRLLAHIDNPYRYDLVPSVARQWRRLGESSVPVRDVISYCQVFRDTCWHF